MVGFPIGCAGSGDNGFSNVTAAEATKYALNTIDRRIKGVSMWSINR